MTRRYSEEICCEFCDRRETVNVVVIPDVPGSDDPLCDHHRDWFELPAGWRTADSYPPGDMGLLFICPSCLTEKQDDGSV